MKKEARKPTVSVVVPVYKVEAYLRRCIESILQQTFTDFELILVDDGSPDNCGSICDEYSLKDHRIKVIHQINKRLSAARNAGLEISSGEWVAFVDSDDWIHRDYLKTLIAGALQDTDVVLCGCYTTSNENEQDIYYPEISFNNANLDDINADNYTRSRAWGRILRRRIIGDLRYIPGTEPAEDFCFNLLLYRDDMKYRITKTELYYYYMRLDSAIHTHMGRGTLNAVEPLLDCLQSIDNKEKRKAVISRCYKFVLSARYGEMYSDDFADVKKHCNKLFKRLLPYCSELNFKERTIMTIMRISPSLYRYWRIKDDPSLVQFENKKKKLQSE